ncbi:TetR/AcrR family transcriptional regulator [Planococcus shenhongbingii]|uniref:TetR/AcrR family transcriptional regulator n=1 Tax=Planococcus shenhongbingii TaxID=3058398 RepID=A0ABT8NDL3_9BACL|nr:MULTISPECIES: TetR/AcrR family transcriptional regulator [unclassified Planococcus (in: firmicutes)]MDN7245600.1 TetR/AcrR family transcriptional regulator [Planococcus sp. N017]WKA60285.1 TetR/AcrR family transcriptional regulator [Planococcus sp. N016]
MEALKVDPRIIRTRKLLMDAFMKIIKKKEFKDITINDIAEEGTVNRATFYSHFQDKYDVMDAAITEDIEERLIKNLSQYDRLNEETIVKVFLTLTKFHTERSEELSSQCRRSYESFYSIIEQKVKKELEELVYSLLVKQQPKLDSEASKIGAAVLSWGIYGASIDWQHNSSLSAEQYIKIALPFIVTELNNLKG